MKEGPGVAPVVIDLKERVGLGQGMSVETSAAIEGRRAKTQAGTSWFRISGTSRQLQCMMSRV